MTEHVRPAGARDAVPAGPEPTAGAPVLSFRSVTKRYGGTTGSPTTALADVSFDVAPGQVVSIVGPSGCGKSTLLRMVAGLTGPTAGSLDAPGGRLGFVFQDPTLLPWRSVQGNLELAGRLAGLDRAERRRRAAEALELTGLTGFERHLPRQLSGGMRMRVSLARELTGHPEVFLLDEPFAALDEFTRQRLDDELLRLQADRGFAVLFVTHNVVEAAYVSHRVLVMSGRPGRVVADVPVPIARPRDAETRFDPDFVAVTHEITARLREVS